MAPMETAPASMHGSEGDNPVPAKVIRACPGRIPLMYRQALGLWSYLNYDEAMKPATQRHAAAYGIVSPLLNLDRSSEVRTVGLNWDFDGNGKVDGKEKLYCLQAQSFDLDRNGTPETSCFEALRVIGGGTPRPIGQSDSIDTHRSIFAGVADASSRQNLSKLVSAIGDGGFTLRWDNNTTTHVKLYPYMVSTQPGSFGGTSSGGGGGSGSLGGGTGGGGGDGGGGDGGGEMPPGMDP